MSKLNIHSENLKPNPDHESELKYCYRYPHAAITADCVIFGFDGKSLKILLVERGNEPYLGCWALPGGFMRMDETIEQTAERELKEETNLSNVYLEQFRVYSNVERDPRERVVTVAFIALVNPEDYNVIAGDDAANAIWFYDSQLPPLAFDHATIIQAARAHLKEILLLKPVAFQLLNKNFTISQLQTVYEVINQTTYDRRNFLRTAIDAEVITEVDELAENSGGRPAKLYTATVSPMETMQDEMKEDAFRPNSENECCNSPQSFGDYECALPESADNEEVPHPLKSLDSFNFDESAFGKPLYDKKTAERKAPTKGLFNFINSFRK